jgi:KUP system potassium uptake protein
MAIVSLKYVVLVLRADNDGEGGILALLSLVASERIANGPGLPILVLLGIAGAALLYGDGVITPAISVLSAMEGLKLITPAFEDFILPLTLAILIGLFMMQRRGTASIGRLFAPVMVGWFLVIGVLGVINIWAGPEILKALSPDAAAHFVFANPLIAFAVMGGVFLALTGAEALYADMGHVGPTAIRRAWFGLVLPALLLNYFGQGALVLTDPQAIDSPFTNWHRIGRSFRWSAWPRWQQSSLPRRSSRASSPSLDKRCNLDFARVCGSCRRRRRKRVRSTCRPPIGC